MTDARLSALPNAGKPRDIEGRNIYLCSPEYMASYARRFIAQRRAPGRRLLRHDARAHPADQRGREADGARGRARGGHGPTRAPCRWPRRRTRNRRCRARSKSRLAAALARGRFVVGVELVPPRGLACAEAIDEAKALAGRHVDVVTVLDGPRAGARMSALSLAVLVQQQAGVETLLQYSCRDKNLLGIQSDLLGAYAMGLRNLLGITGDVRTLGDIPDATAVFDVDSIGLTNVLTRLNHGLDVGGQPIGAADGLSCRRDGQPGRRRSRCRAAPLRVQSGGGRRVRRHAAGVRRRGVRAIPRPHRAASAFRSSPGCGRSRAR